MRAAVFAGLSLIAACDRVSGVDQYSVADDPPRVPYLDGAGCQSCLAANCSTALATCDSDHDCGTTLECRRRCSAPDCHFRCSYPAHDEQAWNDKGTPQPADFAVGACAQEHCASACEVGQSYGCVGRYDWDTPPPGDLVIRHRAFIAVNWGEPVAGASVRVCARLDSTCAAPVAPLITTDPDGRIELTLPDARNHDVYLAIEHPDYPDYVVFGKQRPRFTGEYSAYGMGLKSEFEATLESATKKPFDPSRAYVAPQFFDCAGFGADDLVVDLAVYDGGKLRPCSDCVRAYTVGLAPSMTATHTTVAGSQVWFVEVEPGPVVITARQRSSGRLVARAEVMLQAGRVHGLGVLPLTAAGASP